MDTKEKQQRQARARQLLEGKLSKFLPSTERNGLRECLMGEEGDYFADMLIELEGKISKIPNIYGQEKLGEDAIVHLHYFRGSIDSFITEVNPDDLNDCFGYQCLGDRQLAELGSISIPELINSGVELDLYWTPATLKEVIERIKGGGRH